MNSQGTEMWMIEPIQRTVMKIGCVRALEGVSVVTEADDVAGVLEPGPRHVPGARGSMDLSMEVMMEPARQADKMLVHVAQQRIGPIPFCIGFPDGTTVPSTAGPNWAGLDNTRSWFTFWGVVTGFSVPFEPLTIVTAEIGIRVDDPTFQLRS